jgi:Flp pilus assembly protein TadD
MIASFLVILSVAGGQFFFPSVAVQVRNAIDGQVMTSDRRPVVSARVFLQNDSYSDIASTYTDGSGRFTFRGVASGTYNVVVEPTDGVLERQSQRVEAQAINVRGGRGGEIFRVDIVLKPKKNLGKGGDPSEAGSGNTVFYQEVPEVAKKEFVIALKSLEQNNSDQGIVSLKNALELFPDYYDALERLGSEYVKRRDFNSALPVLEHAVEVNKNGWSSFYYLGVAHMEMKRPEEGVKALQRAVEINPNSINANMRLGIVLATNKDRHAEAIKSFRKVTELAGKQVPDAYLYLAKIYSEQKHYREAADALESYLKLIPQSESQQREQYKKIIEQLRQKASKS